MWKAWLKSDRKDESVWQEFRVLLTSRGFRFHGDERRPKSGWTGGRFAESVVALELPQNPDLAAYLGNKLHFCEVKFNLREQVDEGQLVALAVLQKLLGATVEVVRVVEEQYRELKDPPPYDCDYTIT